MGRLWFGLLAGLVAWAPASVRADAFDLYTNKILEKVPQAQGTMVVKQLTPELAAEHDGVLPGTMGAFLVVRTNDGHWSKLLVQPAQQRVPGKKGAAPILLIQRFVTYKEGEDQTVLVQGQDVRLFQDFVFNLDIGQVVPAQLGGDLRLVAVDGKVQAEPVGKAAVYLITKPLPEAAPPKNNSSFQGGKFQAKFFTGVYKLHDDGRRTGTLHLKVSDEGAVTGHFYSGKDGKKYDVDGQVGDPHHTIEFKITFPRTIETFRGWMFTGNGQVITGFARLEQSEFGFYAEREGNKSPGPGKKK